MLGMAVQLEAHQLLLLFHLLYVCFYIHMCEEIARMELGSSAVDSAVDPVPRPYSVHVGVGA